MFSGIVFTVMVTFLGLMLVTSATQSKLFVGTEIIIKEIGNWNEFVIRGENIFLDVKSDERYTVEGLAGPMQPDRVSENWYDDNPIWLLEAAPVKNGELIIDHEGKGKVKVRFTSTTTFAVEQHLPVTNKSLIRIGVFVVFGLFWLLGIAGIHYVQVR